MPWKNEGEEHLGWLSQSTEPKAPPPAELKPEPKDAGTAFFLSLLLPGMGQAYCGEKKRGWWTFFFFAVSMFLVLWLWQYLEGGAGEQAAIFWGLGLRTALALYAFAFLDAYYTAREKTEGIYALHAYNPRVAAILNLVTRGFGYWYLDEKNKGVLLFVATGIAGRASMRITGPIGDALAIFVELALAAMAVHAYRLARKKNAEKIGPIVSSAPLEPASSFQPHVPAGLAGLIGVAYVSLIALGLTMPDYETIDRTQEVIADTADGKSYKNPKYGVEMSLPAGWQFDASDPGFFLEANAEEGGCNVSLLPSPVFPFADLKSLGEELAAEVQKNLPGARLVETRRSKLAGLEAHEVVLASEVMGFEMRQTYVLARDGLTVYLLIVASSSPDASCTGELEAIRASLVLPR